MRDAPVKPAPTLEKEGGGEFDQADEDAVVLLASWAAIAIEHARLHQASTRRGQELQRALHSLQAGREIAAAVGGEMDLERILELVVKRGRALVKASSLVILLVDGEELVLAANAGEARRAHRQRVAMEGPISGEALGRAERVEDVRARLRISPERLGVPDARSALLVPMLYRGQPVGVLAAFDHGSDAAFGGEDEELLRAFAASAATAQTVAAQRLRATMRAAKDERRRWARELHDQTLQTIGALRISLAAARRRGDLEVWQHAGGEAIGQIEPEIENLRAIIADLRPPMLDELGLATALRALCERQQATTGLRVSCELSPAEPSLEAELETTVYRLVQETLTNIVKHAHATSAQIEIHAPRRTRQRAGLRRRQRVWHRQADDRLRARRPARADRARRRVAHDPVRQPRHLRARQAPHDHHRRARAQPSERAVGGAERSSAGGGGRYAGAVKLLTRACRPGRVG